MDVTRETVNYKIISFEEGVGRILVQYEGLESTPIPIDLPLNTSGLYFSGEELDQYIRVMAPLHLINREIKIKSGVANAEAIHALVQPVEPLTPVAIPVEASTAQSSDLFDVLK